MASPEIVQTAEEARRLSMPPLLILDEVEEYLDQQGLGSGGLTVDRIGDERSNITYRIRRSGVDLVLRRGPRPPLPELRTEVEALTATVAEVEAERDETAQQREAARTEQDTAQQLREAH